MLMGLSILTSPRSLAVGVNNFVICIDMLTAWLKILMYGWGNGDSYAQCYY